MYMYVHVHVYMYDTTVVTVLCVRACVCVGVQPVFSTLGRCMCLVTIIKHGQLGQGNTKDWPLLY